VDLSVQIAILVYRFEQALEFLYNAILDVEMKSRQAKFVIAALLFYSLSKSQQVH